MNTPICDFLKKYSKRKTLRLHMPGHKGKGFLGAERYDITEIGGADSLFDADGIIKMSEENASRLFGSTTFYSTEGSSLCIRAMVYLVCLYAKKENREPIIWASRNVHKTFITAVSQTDAKVEWLYGEERESYLSCILNSDCLDEKLKNAETKPIAIYITSPDYLGNIQDVEAISKVCKRHSVLLLCDNAHGAYLKFFKKSMHPIDLGADIVCDSAHKTLPVLTGGAYLHVSKTLEPFFKENAKKALSFFASTSPSYLIMASLDMANKVLEKDFPVHLGKCENTVENLKNDLEERGFSLVGDEVLKITIDAKQYGYTGFEIAKILEDKNIIPEFADPDYVVLMLSAFVKKGDVKKIKNALFSIERKEAILKNSFAFSEKEPHMSIREATFKESIKIPTVNAEGKTLASLSVSCPPAVPIVMCGEEISAEDIRYMQYYAIDEIEIVKE